MKLLYIIALAFVTLGCVNNNKYTYQVHLIMGDGVMHLYTGQDYADALSYIKEYEKSHGGMKIVRVNNN